MAVVSSCHVLGANDWTAVTLQRFDRTAQRFAIAVVVEGDDVRFFQAEFVDWTELGFIFPEADPYPAGQGLRGVDLASPFKATFGKDQTRLGFVRQFGFGPVATVGVRVVVVEFVDQIPSLDAGIVFESLEDSL